MSWFGPDIILLGRESTYPCTLFKGMKHSRGPTHCGYAHWWRPSDHSYTRVKATSWLAIITRKGYGWSLLKVIVVEGIINGVERDESVVKEGEENWFVFTPTPMGFVWGAYATSMLQIFDCPWEGTILHFSVRRNSTTSKTFRLWDASTIYKGDMFESSYNWKKVSVYSPHFRMLRSAIVLMFVNFCLVMMINSVHLTKFYEPT